MVFDIIYWSINTLTVLVLLSPFFLLLSPFIVLLLVVSIPLSLILFYYRYSLPRSQSSINQFSKISIAHRGGRPVVPADEDFPENSMAAYRWASTIEGADGIELDIWLSKDLVPMVNHDGYLERTFAQCREYISSLTCEQLKQLKYLKKNKRDVYDQLASEIIPTLEEVIVFLEPTKLKLMIEIKETRNIPEMSRIINDLFKRYPFLYERAYCAAFHPYNLYSLRRLNPRITTAFLFAPNLTSYMVSNASETPQPMSIFFAKNSILRWIIDSLTVWFSTPAGLQFLGADLVCIEQGHVSQNLLYDYKKAGIVVCAWCVNQPEQRRWLKTNGVTIITDTLFDIDQQ